MAASEDDTQQHTASDYATALKAISSVGTAKVMAERSDDLMSPRLEKEWKTPASGAGGRTPGSIARAHDMIEQTKNRLY